MATRNISLTEAQDRYIDERIKSGAFQNASEMMRASLRLLQQQEEENAARIERLRAAVQEGIDAYEFGDYEVVEDVGVWLDEIEAEITRD